VTALGLLFGLSYGLSFGDPWSNHPVYLLPGMAMARPGFLAHDWFVNQVYIPHGTFAWVVAGFDRLGILPWGLALGNVIAVAVVAVLAYRQISRTLQADSTVTWLFFGFMFLGIQHTESIGFTYFFSRSLQPSTVATVLLVAAVVAFLERRYLLSGLLLAAGGAFHVNLLILAILGFAGAQLLLGPTALLRRVVRQLFAPMIVLAFELPILLAVATDDYREEARHILVNMLYPLHYLPAREPSELVEFGGWQLLGFSVLAKVAKPEAYRSVRALYLSLALVVVAPLCVNLFLPVSFVTQLFPWRLAPLLNYLAALVIAAAACRMLLRDTDGSAFILETWRVVAAGVGALLVLAGAYEGHWTPGLMIRLMLFGGLALLWLQMVAKPGPDIVRALLSPSRRRCIQLLICAFLVGAWRNVHPQHFNVVRHDSAAPESQLYGWVRTTPLDAQFLVPPSLEQFRLLGHRAIVVDEKNPIIPSDVVAWYRRLEDVSGRPGFGSLPEAEAGYHEMTPERLDSLIRRYGVDYAVFRAHFPGNQLNWPVVYANDGFVVLDLGSREDRRQR
jgi:hypothetical protein